MISIRCSGSLLLLFLFLLPACGSLGHGDAAPDVVTQIQGVANDAIIEGGVVTVYQFDQGYKGVVLATAVTNTKGLFTLSFPRYWGPVLFEIRGGSFTDDATGKIIYLSADQYLSSVRNIQAGEVVGNLAITPVSTIAASLAKAYINDGMAVPTAIDTANSALSTLYGFDILNTTPANLTEAASSGSSSGALYGLVLAGVSEMAFEISASGSPGQGATSSIALADAMAADALDGYLDGRSFGQQISFGTYFLDSYAYRTRLCQNAILFLSSSRNLSGLGWNDVANELNRIAASKIPSLFPSVDSPMLIDSTPPSLTISINKLVGWTYSVVVQSTDPQSGVAGLVLAVSPAVIPDTQAVAGVSSSISILVDFSLYPDGPYTFTATSRNGISLQSTSTSLFTNSYNYCQIYSCAP